jgi:hypothetical protein
LWIEQGTTRLAMFGELPYADLVLVAGYPLDAFADHDFIIYRDELGPQRRSLNLRVGRALPEELATWR